MIDKRLVSLTEQFTQQGLTVSLKLDPNQIILRFPKLPDYGAVVTLENDNLSVEVFESFAGTEVGRFWTTNPKDVIPLALLIIVSCDCELEARTAEY